MENRSLCERDESGSDDIDYHKTIEMGSAPAVVLRAFVLSH